MNVPEEKTRPIFEYLFNVFKNGKGSNCLENKILRFKQRMNPMVTMFIREKIAKLRLGKYKAIYKKFSAPHNEQQHRFIVRNRKDIIFDGNISTADYMRSPDISCYVYKPEIQELIGKE